MNDNWDRVLNKDAPWALDGWVNAVCDVLSFCDISPDLLLDVGPGVANSEAWIFKKKFSDLKIFGFEPQHDRHDFLSAIYPGALFKKAIVSYPGSTMGMMGHRDGVSDFNLFDYDGGVGRNQERVECDSIDNVLAKNPDFKRVFIWADIEGSELEMLRGAVKSLMSDKVIAISLELNFDRDALTVIEFLSRFNFYPVGSTSGNTRTVNQDEIKAGRWCVGQIIPDNDHVQCDLFFLKTDLRCSNDKYFQVSDERKDL